MAINLSLSARASRSTNLFAAWLLPLVLQAAFIAWKHQWFRGIPAMEHHWAVVGMLCGLVCLARAVKSYALPLAIVYGPGMYYLCRKTSEALIAAFPFNE